MDDFADADWAEIYERQAARGGLVDRFVDLLGLSRGDDVLCLGSGPGYTALELADIVRPGTVVAIDRRPGALGYLQSVAGGTPVCPVAGDATALPLCPGAPTAALAAFLLHHVADPGAVLASVGRALPLDSRLLVVEYHPDAPGEFGPGLERRLAPGDVRARLGEAGFTIERTVDLPEEKYAVRARRE
jgi:ubiquinone/menaquinone biosynthesis C-methylase UbiE